MEPKIVLLLIFILILYLFYIYDIIRYISLHFESDDMKYIKNYKKLKKYMECRVVVSLTTTPDRIKKIKPVLKSLLDQTIKVDRIILNIPNSCNGSKYDVPEDYKDICNVYNCGRDYGPGTKFIPTILRETSANTIIIMLDDDYIYSKDFLETILNKYKKNPDCSICTKEAMLIKPEFLDVNVIYTNKKYIDDDWIKKYIKSNIINLDYNKNLRSFLIN